jgi:hypothetical protein
MKRRLVCTRASDGSGAGSTERLDNAIAVTAYVMQRHGLPQLLPTLKRLEAELEKLRTDGDPIEYAKGVLERRAIEVRPIADQRRLAA